MTIALCSRITASLYYPSADRQKISTSQPIDLQTKSLRTPRFCGYLFLFRIKTHHNFVLDFVSLPVLFCDGKPRQMAAKGSAKFFDRRFKLPTTITHVIGRRNACRPTRRDCVSSLTGQFAFSRPAYLCRNRK